MHSENFLVNDGSNGQTVEAVGKCLPQLDIVPAFTFIVEAIDTVNRCALVITPQNEEVLGILDLVGEQKANGLE